MIRALAALAALILISMPPAALAQAREAPPPPTARQLELAQQILDETGTTKNYETMMRDLFGRITAQSAAMTGGSAEAKEFARLLNEAITAAIIKIKPQLLAVSVNTYAQTFSEEELAGILAFYRTPVGQAMAAKMPDLARNIADATAKVMPEMMTVMQDELCVRSPATCPQAREKAAPKAPRT